MEDIQDVHFVELENSKYLKPIRMKYTQASRCVMLRLDMINTHIMNWNTLTYLLDKYTFKDKYTLKEKYTFKDKCTFKSIDKNTQ